MRTIYTWLAIFLFCVVFWDLLFPKTDETLFLDEGSISDGRALKEIPFQH